MTTEAHLPPHTQQPETYTPGWVVAKVLYLAFGLLLTGYGLILIWQPLGRLVFGEVVTAPVTQIVRVEPGIGEQVFAYRRTYSPEVNMAVTFQHYVSVPLDKRTVLLRLGVDSRKIPYANVNDRLRVAYYPQDTRRLAWVVTDPRSWGIPVLLLAVATAFIATGIPMLLAARRPIRIDP